MKLCKDLALIAALLMLAAALFRLATLFAAAEEVTRQAPALVRAEAKETRLLIADELNRLGARAETEIALTRQTAVAEIARTRATLSGDLGATVGILDGQLESLHTDANLHGIAIERLAARELGRAVDGWGEVADETRATLAASRRTVEDLHPQLLGLIAASKVSAGETAQTLRVIRDAAPAISQGVVRTVANTETISFGLANPFRPIGRVFRFVGRKIKSVF